MIVIETFCVIHGSARYQRRIVLISVLFGRVAVGSGWMIDSWRLKLRLFHVISKVERFEKGRQV